MPARSKYKMASSQRFLAGLFVGLFVFYAASMSCAQNTDCLPYSLAAADPSKASCVIIDCETDDCAQFLAGLNQFENLNRLEVVRLHKDYFPKDLSSFPNLTEIVITESPELNFNALFRKLGTLSGLKKLVLDNNGLQVLPKSIILLSGLTSLSIRNNESFQVEKSIVIMSHLPKLKELSIPVNQIQDLPENISLLKNLEVLDLSDNQLSDLPREMGEMDSLEVLNIEKNIFINPVKTLEKLKGLNIKYLSVDVGLTDRDKEKLEKIFPKAEIVEVIDTSTSDDPLMDISGNIFGDAPEDTIQYEYKTIIIGEEKFRALSDAYLHYPAIFDRPNFKSTFDSTLFDERYMDTTYCNVYKVQPWNGYKNIQLYLCKSQVKGEIWFDFHIEGKRNENYTANPYISKNNPEMLAFLGLKWVYQGKLNLRQFKSEYIKNINGSRYWNDVRVYYNEKDQNFTLELKDNHGFTQITAIARNNSEIVPIEKTQESYALFYDRYIKALDNRRKRFHKKLFRDKAAYDMTLQRSIVSAWESFRKMYMSPEEQKMSRKTWLEYYDVVIANEISALRNSAPTATLLDRSFTLKGFDNMSNDALSSDTSKVKGVYAMFKDEGDNMVAVTKVLLVNMLDNSYRSIEGSLGLKNIRLYFSVPGRYTILAECRNGDIGILGPQDFTKQNVIHNKDYIFVIKRLPKKIVTIGDILEEMGL